MQAVMLRARVRRGAFFNRVRPFVCFTKNSAETVMSSEFVAIVGLDVSPWLPESHDSTLPRRSVPGLLQQVVTRGVQGENCGLDVCVTVKGESSGTPRDAPPFPD